MAQLTIQVNGKPYVVGCEDGEEAQLEAMAAIVDARVRAVDPGMGGLGDTRLILMGALVLADEAAEGKARLKAAEAEIERLLGELANAGAGAVAALEAAASKIEAMALR